MKPSLNYYFFFFMSIAFCDIYVSDLYEYTRFSKYVKENVLPVCQSAIESTSDSTSESTSEETSESTSESTSEETSELTSKQVKQELKYILQWTPSNEWPFNTMEVGQQKFIDRKCLYINCFVTSNRTLLGDYTKFDVIAYSAIQVRYYKENLLPQKRSPHQKYVFATLESSANYPVTPAHFDNFFNWTWTYKLDSDSRWGYVVVRDINDKIIGPNKIMHWMKHEDMLPVSEELWKILRRKKKTAAWFVSKCRTKIKRENYVAKLNNALQSKYNLSVDIYGKCGKLKCKEGCEEMVRRDYFFYLSFENSFSEDYVTEKLVRALEYNAVPIVYGGANYSRFLSEGSYINARDFKEEMLAAKIYKMVNDFEQYVEYFRWTNHYKYHRRGDRTETDDYCGMCALLNDDSNLKKISVYREFRKWWNP